MAELTGSTRIRLSQIKLGTCTQDRKEYRDVQVHLKNGTTFTRRQLCGYDDEHETAERLKVKERIFGQHFPMKGAGKDAIKKVLEEKDGFVEGAFFKKGIGEIDVVYGKITDPVMHRGYGIVHIMDKHPGVTPELIEEIINKGKISKTHNGFDIDFGDYRVGINRGFKDNKQNYLTTDHWVVTSFNRKKERGMNSTIASDAAFTSESNSSENPLLISKILYSDSHVNTLDGLFMLMKGA